jgi:hypothetical protein
MKGKQAMDDRWPVWKLALMLYVFAAGAVAINLFMLGLLGQAIGLRALSPVATVLVSIPLGIPAAWASGMWARHLMDEAS